MMPRNTRLRLPTYFREPTWTQELRWWLASLALLAVVVLPFRAAVADWHDVPTGSMRPTLVEGDRIVVDNRAFGLRLPLTQIWLARWDEPRRGDIVTLRSPESGTRLVKRVIAVAGDEIALRDGRLWLNDQPLPYELSAVDLREEVAPDTPVEAQHLREGLTDRPHTITRLSDRRVDPRRLSRDFGPVTIADGQIFVMGDNRDLSHDSRAFGPVYVGQVMGRAHHVAFSLDPDRWRTPRRGRWWRELI